MRIKLMQIKLYLKTVCLQTNFYTLKLNMESTIKTKVKTNDHSKLANAEMQKIKPSQLSKIKNKESRFCFDNKSIRKQKIKMITTMKETTMSPVTFATRAGLILMAVPSLFWLGVVLAVGFEKPVIVQEIMLPVDQISSLFTLMIMIGLPTITFLVNLKAVMFIEFNPNSDNVFIDIHYRRNKSSWFLMVYAVLSIVVTISYAFFENFNFYSDLLKP